MKFNQICFRTNSVDQNDVDIASAPLKFEDIVDKKSYDKMRPPKPGGTLFFAQLNYAECV